MTSPLVSVVVPIYNVQQYLPQCLDSLVNQQYKNLEIICVNDGSTDNSLAILEKYKQRDDRIIIISQPNKGLSATRNTGLKHVTGEFVVFVDSDDWLELDAISLMSQIFKTPEIDFLCFGTQIHTEGNDDTASYYGRTYSKSRIVSTNSHWITKINVSAWSKIYRTEFLKTNDLLFPVGLYYEDIAFYWKCISLARKIALSSHVLYNYRIRKNSIMGNSYVKKKGMAIHHIYELDNVYQFLEKNNFLNSNKDLFQFLIEKYIHAGWKYVHDEDKDIYISETKQYINSWHIEPKRYTLAFDLINNNKINQKKYRTVLSLRKKYYRLLKLLGKKKNSIPFEFR